MICIPIGLYKLHGTRVHVYMFSGCVDSECMHIAKSGYTTMTVWLCIHISCATLSIKAKIGTCLAMELTNVVAQLVEVIV